MLKRSYSAEEFNAVLNHPSVHDNHNIDGPIDVSDLVGDPNNILLTFPGGGFLFKMLAPSLYNAHPNVIDSARGPDTALRFREALHYLFSETPAVEVSMNALHKGIHSLAGNVGFSAECSNGNATVYTLNIRDWVRTAPEPPQRGDWFRRRLSEELGVKLAPDPSSERYGGAAVDMIFGGQMGKASAVYNRWAALCAKPPMLPVSQKAIDIGNAIVYFSHDDIWVD